MARTINRLTTRAVSALQRPGMHADGGGLYLRVTKAGSKQWVYIYRWHGKRREMGLGGVGAVTLARAREKAAEARASVADKTDPLAAKAAKTEIPTFGKAADEFIIKRKSTLRSDKSVARSSCRPGSPARRRGWPRAEPASETARRRFPRRARPWTGSSLRRPGALSAAVRERKFDLR